MSNHTTIRPAPDAVQPPQASASTNSAIRASDGVSQKNGSSSSPLEFTNEKLPEQGQLVTSGREIGNSTTRPIHLAPSRQRCQRCDRWYLMVWTQRDLGGTVQWSSSVLCPECTEIMRSGPRQPLPVAKVVR